MIHLGTSGWYYADWSDVFYPDEISKSDWLSFYARFFDTVEVNASFYRLPSKNMVKRWKKKTPKDFLLTFKGSQIITHRKKLFDVEEHLKMFFNRIKLTEKIGVLLWQLPPNFGKNLNRFEHFLTLLDSDLRHCVEFRHTSWFDKKIYSLLEQYNVAFCMMSAPSLPSPVRVTTDFAYIRWHGKDKWYNYNYSKQELKKWANILIKLNVEDVFGYFNNDYLANAPKNCLYLKQLIE